MHSLNSILSNVTRSAKTGLNRASLNLPYEVLNTLGEALAYY